MGVAPRDAAVCLAILLAGCAVGPDFHAPPAPSVQTYTGTDGPATLAPGSGETEQRIAAGTEIAAEWWELFGSPELTAAVRRAMAGSQTVAAARASLAQAREVVVEARAAFFPQVDFSASASRQQLSSSRSGVGSGQFDLFSIGPTVSYSPDLFGGTRRHVEEEAALAEQQGWQLAGAYLTLTGNVVGEVLDVAGTRLEIAAVEKMVADDDRTLDLVRLKFEGGKAAETDVLSAETQRANDQAQLPPLRQRLATDRHALAILAGAFPADWSPPELDLASLSLPGELPLTLPSELVHQRPDILAAEADLHAASAGVGVATAAMFPSIQLSASVGQAAVTGGALFEGASSTWALASALAAPIFHGGALAAGRRAAIDAYEGSFATYRETVLTAFGQVADTLDALAHDADLVADQRHALDVASRSLVLQRLSFQEGKTDLLQLLDAERLALQARLGYARAETQRYEDTATLLVAMGGRWWASPPT